MQPKKHYFAHIPTIAIFIVFAMSAPLGVLLFILKSIDKSAEKEETAAAQAQADYRSDLGPEPAQTAPRQENEPAYGHDVPTKEQKDAKERHTLLTTLCTIGGAVFLFAGFSTLFMDGADSMMEAFTAIAQMLGGGAALLTGRAWIVPASWNACWTRSQATATIFRWTSCLLPRASMPQRAAPWWKVLFPTVTSVQMLTLITAPILW